MFRPVYWRITLTLIASTLTLLIIVGSVVYGSLSQVVKVDEESRLSADLVDLHETLPPAYFTSHAAVYRYNYMDELGEHDYFFIYRGNQVAIESARVPVPFRLVSQVAAASKYSYLEYKEVPYRIKSRVISTPYGPYHILMYRSIATEERVLRHVITLISEVGAAGMLLAIAFNLWLGNTVLRPARVIWEAQQTMLVELSHELQTPLATMHAVTNQVDSPAVRDRLRREILNASDLVANILYLSKLRVLPKQMYEPVAVSDLTEEIAERMDVLANRRGIEFKGAAEPGAYVLTSPETWTRLASTIFKNVVDHAMPNSTAHWQITVEQGAVVFQIANEYDAQSSSMPAGAAQRRFGMTIVHRLAASMGGRIDVRTESNKFQLEVQVPQLRPT